LRLLLDTHIWLWSLAEPKQLSPNVQHELRDPNNELWLSPVSTWEVLLLNAKGRIRLLGGSRDCVARATVHPREAPLTHEIVLVEQELPLPNQDPAGRFLAATAGCLD
jgi:PIN domain nuclease of toxin-antitoxin system